MRSLTDASATEAPVCIHERVQRRVHEAAAAWAASDEPASAHHHAGPVRHAVAAAASRGRPLAAVELPSVGRNVAAGQGAPPRVFSDMENRSSSACHRAGQTVPTALGGVAVCTAADVLNATQRRVLIELLVPQAVHMHTSRLQVQRAVGSWVVGAMVGDACAAAPVPRSHTTAGAAMPLEAAQRQG